MRIAWLAKCFKNNIAYGKHYTKKYNVKKIFNRFKNSFSSLTEALLKKCHNCLLL